MIGSYLKLIDCKLNLFISHSNWLNRSSREMFIFLSNSEGELIVNRETISDFYDVLDSQFAEMKKLREVET